MLIFLSAVLFLVKYLSRFTSLYLPAVILFIISCTGILILIEKKININKELSPSLTKKILFVVFILMLLILVKTVPSSLQVDRSVEINNWLQNFSDGIFPYSNLPAASGLPFLYYLAAPFYFIGDVRVIPVVGVIIFLLLINKHSSTKKEFLSRMFFMLSSPLLFFELITGSELFTNTVLFVLVIILSEQYLDEKKPNIKYFFLALLLGCMIATRLIFFELVILYILFFFRSNLKNGALFLLISLTIFTLILLPYYNWNPGYFLAEKFFIIQFLRIPMWIILLISLAAVYIGWLISDIQELSFSIGILLFSLITISFVLMVFKVGFYTALFKGAFDITYYTLCFPFLIFSIKEYKVDWFLGKVIPISPISSN